MLRRMVLLLLFVSCKEASVRAAEVPAAYLLGLLAQAGLAPGDASAVVAASPGPMRQTLEGSFSAVSTPNFASKYALESSRRDLQNALLCTVLESNPKKRSLSSNFSSKIAIFSFFLQIFNFASKQASALESRKDP